MTPLFRSLVAATALAMPPSLGADPAAVTATITAHFTLVDHEERPLAATTVRLVLGRFPGWQRPGAGHTFETDAKGTHRLTMPAPIERRARKRPTNFVSSLLSREEPTDFLQVGAELAYGGVRRLHVLQLHRFEDGTVLREGVSVLSADAHGDFTRRAEFDGRTWKLADLGGLALSSPGHEPIEAALRRGPGTEWALELRFRRAPEPLRR